MSTETITLVFDDGTTGRDQLDEDQTTGRIIYAITSRTSTPASPNNKVLKTTGHGVMTTTVEPTNRYIYDIGDSWNCLECRVSLMLGFAICVLILLTFMALVCYAWRHWCLEYPKTRSLYFSSCCERSWKKKCGLDNVAYANDDFPKGNKYIKTLSATPINKQKRESSM